MLLLRIFSEWWRRIDVKWIIAIVIGNIVPLGCGLCDVVREVMSTDFCEFGQGGRWIAVLTSWEVTSTERCLRKKWWENSKQ